MYVVFSHGSCVWVRHLAGQFNKQRRSLSCDGAAPHVLTVTDMIEMCRPLLPIDRLAAAPNKNQRGSFIGRDSVLAWLWEQNYKDINARWSSVWLNTLIDWPQKSAARLHVWKQSGARRDIENKLDVCVWRLPVMCESKGSIQSRQTGRDTTRSKSQLLIGVIVNLPIILYFLKCVKRISSLISQMATVGIVG